MKRHQSKSKKLTDSASYASSEGFDDTASVDTERDDTKRKSRNLSEKKRRDQFNVLVNELCSMVYCDPSGGNPAELISGLANNRKMDKSSVLRSTINFLKHNSEVTAASQAGNKSNESGGDLEQTPITVSDSSQQPDSWRPSSLSHDEFAQLMLEAMDAFILVVEANSKGNIIYASESILPLLGYNPTKFKGSKLNNSDASDDQSTTTSLFDLLHESDKDTVSKLLLDGRSQDLMMETYSSVLLHFKQNSSRAPYSHELVRLLGTFYTISDPGAGGKDINCFVSVGRLQTPKLLKELRMVAPPIGELMPIQNKEFVSRHSLEWKFLFLDHRASALIGYMPFEVLGTSGYDYLHWDDLDVVIGGHEQLMQTGEGTSSPYRFLTKGQQWIWLVTRYYITYHQWNSKPEFVVCTHTIIGYDDDSMPEPYQVPLIELTSRRTTSLGSTGSLSSSDSPIPSSSSMMTMSASQTKHKSKFRYKSSKESSDGGMSVNITTSGSDYSDTSSVATMSQQRIVKHRIHPGLDKNSSSSSTNVILHQPLTPPSSLVELGPYKDSRTVRQKSDSSMSLPHQVQSSSQFHEYLRRKHHQLLLNIQQQQDELKKVSNQLKLVQFAGGSKNSSDDQGFVDNQEMSATSGQSEKDAIAWGEMDNCPRDSGQLTTASLPQEQAQIVFSQSFDE